jgi:hypothetical protein
MYEQCSAFSSNALWCFFKKHNLVLFSSSAFYSCVKHYVPMLDTLAFKQIINEKQRNRIVHSGILRTRLLPKLLLPS